MQTKLTIVKFTQKNTWRFSVKKKSFEKWTMSMLSLCVCFPFATFECIKRIIELKVLKNWTHNALSVTSMKSVKKSTT